MTDTTAAHDEVRELFQTLTACTAAELGRAFAHYYPMEGEADIPEALTATYLAFQFRDHGFFVYPQIQLTGLIDNHLDFAAVHPTTRVAVLGEAKRLFRSDKACELGADWVRLRSAAITSELRRLPTGTRYFGCLVATTWDETYRAWWEGPRRGAVPGRERIAAHWADLKDALDRAVLTVAATVPRTRDGWADKLHVLFAFVPLAGPGGSPEK